ncbi:MAG: dienelactone hydrolase family protein [Bacteroidales bacterium]
MDNKINDLFNGYRRGEVSRRDFLRKLTLCTGSVAAAATLLSFTNEHNAPPAEVNSIPGAEGKKDKSGVVTEFITYPGASGEMKAFLARPAKKKKYPAVIVVHEIFGLNQHIRDVVQRFAQEGFLTIAPDALSSLGGTPDDNSKAAAMIRELDGEATTKNYVAAVKYLKTHPLSTGKVGCTGFCWGGAMTNQVAVNEPGLDAAVPYYGRTPASEDVPKIKAPILAHFAGDDARINEGIPAFEEALKKAGKEYRIFVYEGAKHAFNNDSNPERYDAQAAKLAWERTIAFFKEKLK